MSNIIDKLKSNSFNRVDKTDKKCPICNSSLYIVDNWLDNVCDGNGVYQCENNIEHKFWQNARESSDILHLNKNSTSTNFESEKDYKLIDNKWIMFN